MGETLSLNKKVEKMLLYPNCKINLGLNVLRKRSDGYHDLETLFYPVNATEALLIEKSDSFSFSVEGIAISGTIEENLCVRAWRLMAELYDLPAVSMTLFKYLPMGAGLGGGSADGAFVFRGVNQLFNLGLTDVQLALLASQIGSDCPFFIYNKPMLATGRGDLLEPVDLSLSQYYIRLIKPSFGISTKEAYDGIIPNDKNSLSIREFIDYPIEQWQELLKNDFESHLSRKYPELEVIKTQLKSQGAVFTAMSGSGSTLFGLFKEVPPHYFVKPGYWCYTGPLM